MNRIIHIWLLILGFSSLGYAQEYSVFVDLGEMDLDRLKVTIYPPPVNEEEIVFSFPRFAPGGFEELRVAPLVSEMRVFNQKSFAMRTEKVSENRFLIPNATKIRTIEYYIDDTWDQPGKNPWIFPPLGTSFDLNQAFLINMHHLLGYFEGMENYPITITFYTTQGYELSSAALNTSQKGFIKRVYYEDYAQMSDNPVLIAPPDTASFMVDSTKFYISLVSDNEQVNAEVMQRAIKPVCEALFKFSGGIPLDEFHFLILLKADKKNQSQEFLDQFGAIQHSRSAVYYFPAYSDTGYLKRQIQMTAAHEMLHIYPPLNIQTDLTSKQNFQDRQYTRHLWFFEGITEYFSLLMQVRYGLIDYDNFIREMRNKINLAEVYEPFSLVEASQGIDQEGNTDIYQNFYNKGALVAMLLDIHLLEQNDGQLGLQGLLYRLHEKLGSGLVIKDEALIEEMSELAETDLSAFYEKYIQGTNPLPYAEYFGKLGLVYEENIKDKVRVYAVIEPGVDPGSGQVVVESMQLNFIGLQKGDIILQINDQDITPENFQAQMERISRLSAPAPATFTVFRDGKSLVLTGQAMIAIRNEKNVLIPDTSTEAHDKDLKERLIKGCEFMISRLN